MFAFIILYYFYPENMPVKWYSPSDGTEDAVGGAASTRMSRRRRKLANILMAKNRNIERSP